MTPQQQEELKRQRAQRRELDAMRERFPQLRNLSSTPVEGSSAQGGEGHCLDDADIGAVYDAYVGLIPTFHPPAREAQLRTSLVRLKNKTESTQLQSEIMRAIAESDIRSGVIHSTYVRNYPDLWESVQDMMAEHDAAYGAIVFNRTWKRLSRGGGINYYFGNHENLIKGKKILHIAPEAETKIWFNERANALDMTYATLNLGGDVDFIEDLTKLEIEDQSFDWIICHRVLEHIFDDISAMREAFRILRPGGIFNVSVPESMHLKSSEDWLIPDLAHHYHYRQYGGNFADLLSSARFEVEPVRWLLERTPEELDAAGTYPLRMYNARKP